MISSRLTRKLGRLNDEALHHVEEHVDLLLEMPDQVRPLTLVGPTPDPGPDHWEQRLVRLDRLPVKTRRQVVALLDTMARYGKG
jgi:hypothetical protein